MAIHWSHSAISNIRNGGKHSNIVIVHVNASSTFQRHTFRKRVPLAPAETHCWLKVIAEMQYGFENVPVLRLRRMSGACFVMLLHRVCVLMVFVFRFSMICYINYFFNTFKLILTFGKGLRKVREIPITPRKIIYYVRKYVFFNLAF